MYAAGIASMPPERGRSEFAVTQAIPLEFDGGQTRIVGETMVKSYQAAMSAHGVEVSPLQVAEALGTSFTDMVRATAEKHPELQDAQLVIVAHHTPDLIPGDVPAVTMVASQSPGAAAGFAVCDEGPLVSFTAVDLARRFASRHGYRRALVLVAENATYPYAPDSSESQRVDRGACVLLVVEPSEQSETVIDRRFVSAAVHPEAVERTVLQLAESSLERAERDGFAAAFVLGHALRDHATAVSARTEREVILGDVGQPATAVWRAAARRFGQSAPVPIILMDFDPEAQTLVACGLLSPGTGIP
ncbi:hypothetical protein [Curtobacterium sp. MCPF17_031]|uniref:hypothetical protein n=1 Tax=Curtobacterium sp. MCPF17_031 TaxID=2175653 RepID=UPI000DA737AC|nr:hypothetical protein [Curtobacterium sp. MCPF17_031]PZE34231.1 hypothetical protein DEJ31_15150 [Curtobacterium sp. MCPF17_031]